jgi:hypothetical protein
VLLECIKLLKLANNFVKESQERKKGKSLCELGYEYKKALIFRACSSHDFYFHSMDYVTRSKKFAVEHADHNVSVLEEDQHVLKAVVNATDVYEAYNPGEYFYDGPEIKGHAIYVVKAE